MTMRPLLLALTLAFVANAHGASTLIRPKLPPAVETGNNSVLRVNSTNQAYDFLRPWAAAIPGAIDIRVCEVVGDGQIDAK